MMNMKRSMGMFVPFDINIMTYDILKDIVDEESSEGLGAVAALLLHLTKFEDCIAKLSDVDYVGAQIHKRGFYMRRIINDYKYKLFCVTRDGKWFFSPYLRLRREAGRRWAEEWLPDTSMTEEEASEREAAINNQITNNKR